MTLPPCPIAGHDNPHHWHDRKQKNKQIWHVDHRDGGHGIVCTFEGGGLSRCYSAHVPEPSPDPDEWVRVPVGTRIPAGTLYFPEKESHVTVEVRGVTYLRRSDLDAILKPAPTPAEKMAEALTQLVIGAEDAWLPDDVQSALDAAGLTLAERAEK